MRIIVTGSSGFIGGHLVDHLRKNGHQVICMDRKTGPELLSYPEHFIQDYHVDCMIHLAAQTSVWNTNTKLIELDNIRSFMYMCDVCKKLGIKFIYTSSSCAYNITSMYGLSKQFDEQYAKMYGGENCIGLRLHNVYGKNPRPDTLLGKCMNNDSVVLYNNGGNSRHFTYIDDVLWAIDKSMELVGNKLVNVYNPEINTVMEFVNEVSKYHDFSCNTSFSLSPEIRPLDKKVQEVDESLPNLLGDFHYTNIKDGIRKCFETIDFQTLN